MLGHTWHWLSHHRLLVVWLHRLLHLLHGLHRLHLLILLKLGVLHPKLGQLRILFLHLGQHFVLFLKLLNLLLLSGHDLRCRLLLGHLVTLHDVHRHWLHDLRWLSARVLGCMDIDLIIFVRFLLFLLTGFVFAVALASE